MQYPKLVESKTSANEVLTIEWNPTMDLLATVFSNGALTCSRLLLLQKVWHKPSNGDITSIAWRPDGRVLAIGAYNKKTKENVCTLHDVENGKKINTILKDKTISTVGWFQYNPISDDKKREEQYQLKKKNQLEADTNDNFSHQLAHEQNHLNILLISTDDGLVSLYALGLFHLGDVSGRGTRNRESKIVKIHLSSCLKYLTHVTVSKNSYDSTFNSLSLRYLDTFETRRSEILRVSKMYAKITDELEYLHDTINAITTSWVDVLAGLDNKLSSYCSRKNKRSIDCRSGYTFLSADELLQLLVIGFPSDNLEKFLTDMSDKGLKKLNNAIEQTCLRVQNLIVKNAQKCCYHLHNDLNLLRGMSLWRERYQDIGLDDKIIVDAMRSVGSLMLKLTELQQVIDHSLKSTKSFFRWLISIACRMTGEQNNSVVPNDINKTSQQDIQLITDFILENFDYNSNMDEIDGISMEDCERDGASTDWSVRPTCSNFTLEQVGQYLKNEPLSRLKYSFTKPDSNFWIEFFNERPGLSETKRLDEDGSSVLLFYPHNPNTSLIQEHASACKSIETAFKSVTSNFKLWSDDVDTSLSLDEFATGAATSRIRIETDMRIKQHFTLFQFDDVPAERQYLLVQSLTDRLLFKLISIEFHPNRRQRTHAKSSSNQSKTFHISDSSFYENKATKKLLVSFLLLDENLGDTIMIQIEMDKLLEGVNWIVPRLKSRAAMSTICRTRESIEENCTQVVLKLDMYTEPAHERKHGCEMMVKKIKNTVGRDMFSSSGCGVIAFTSCDNKRLHLYELVTGAGEPDIMDDEIEVEEKIDESLIDTDLMG